MKHLVLSLAVVAIAIGAFSLTPATAQEQPVKPEFDNAPVTDVLKWAQKSIGCGFVYEGEDLNDSSTGSMRRVTANHAEPETRAEKTLLLFELLKRCGLVAFEIGGMPGPTYQLYTAEAAARNATIFNHPDDIGGAYFAALTIRLRNVGVQTIAPRVRAKLSKGAGSMEVFEDTHSLIVTDYADRLVVAWEIAMAADEAMERSDDLVVEDFVPLNGVASRYAAGMERLRSPDESWRVTVNEASNLLLFSGRRDELNRVIDRLNALDAREADPAFAETTQAIKLIYLKPEEAASTLRQMFDTEVKSGSVQIAGFERDRKLLFRGSQYDFERAKASLKAIDTKPENAKD